MGGMKQSWIGEAVYDVLLSHLWSDTLNNKIELFRFNVPYLPSSLTNTALYSRISAIQLLGSAVFLCI